MFGGDKRTGEVEQVQVREAEGDRDGMGKGLHGLFSFKARQHNASMRTRRFRWNRGMACAGAAIASASKKKAIGRFSPMSTVL